MNDLVQRGVTAGLLGTVGDALIHEPSRLLLGTSTTSQYISQLMFPFQDVTPVRYAFGFLTHFFAGALIGVVLALILKLTGETSAYLKGIGFGIVLWGTHVLAIPNIVSPRPFLYRTELEVLVDLLAHIVYGTISTAYLLKTSNQAIS